MSDGAAAMHWWRWGEERAAAPLTAGMRGLVESLFGIQDNPGLDRSDVRLPPPGLAPELVVGLRQAIGQGDLLDDEEARLLHTRGRSTPDLHRTRQGDVVAAPDAVVRPDRHEDVLAVLRYCAEHRIAVVPFGGGTSVVAGLSARRNGFAGLISLDLGRMNRLLAVDPISRTATLEPGLRGPEAESLLATHGFTLGHFPQSFEYATIGGFAATRSSGQSSAGYGRFDAMIMALRVATPTGTLELGTAPASAAGPDLRQLVLGSEGAFGVITAVTVRVRPAPPVQAYEGWHFASFDAGLTAIRHVAQSGARPTVLRLSDDAETALTPGLSAAGGASAGCLLIAGYEGEEAGVAGCRDQVAQLLAAAGGTDLGSAPGQAWVGGRFAGPYLRDAMLDVGVWVETLETATFWAGALDLYTTVRQVLTERLSVDRARVLVLCHISHLYETGCSLYFTVVTSMSSEPIERWSRAKAAASDAIIAAGATITHHHGVGRDHRDWLAAEIGPLGVRILRAVKAELDPAGVLNPGVLVP